MSRPPHLPLFLRSSLPSRAVRGSLFVACLVALGCGSGSGTVADQPLVIPDVSEVSAGDPTCPAGGVRVDLGVDDNRDGDLDTDEIDSTSYVCNGTDMMGGEDDVLVRNVDLPLGDAECPAGGRRLDVGLDNGDGNGVADNDILEDDEVDTSFLDCNGAMTVVVTPPTGTPGTAVLDTHGGNGDDVGGLAGSITEEASRYQLEAHMMFSETGTVDASCTVPTLVIDLGSVPVAITADTTVEVVAMVDEPNLDDGTIFTRPGDANLYVWDETNGVARRATGLRVAAGVTATFEHNSPYSGLGVGLSLPSDVDVAGAITTVAASGQKGHLVVNARQVRLAATSSIDLRGSNGDQSGNLELNTNQDLVALGSIDTTGHSGTSGVNGGAVDFNSGGAIYTGGTIVTEGGDASSGNGGGGGSVEYQAYSRMICNSADITTTGGDADGTAGGGGYINIGDDCVYGSTVEIRNTGSIRTRGGAQLGACNGTCAGGGGAPITFIAVESGSISSSGPLDTRGGNADNGPAGNGGEIEVRPGAYFESIEAISLYQFTGDITTFGGDGEAGNGGVGGRIVVLNQGALGSFTRFLGYASVTLDGGDGGDGGGNAGSIDFRPNMSRSTGGLGLFVHTDLSATGGNGGDLPGGRGGSIVFNPDPDTVTRDNAAVENFIVTGAIDLSGGSGAPSGGDGGSIRAVDVCNPHVALTGVRIDGTVTLDGGAGTNGSGGASGGLFLATARGAAVVAGTVHAVGGAGAQGNGGAFVGSSIVGAPARVTATFTATGGTGTGLGGDAQDIAVLSIPGTSSVTGTVSLTAGTGPSGDGALGSLRVDTGTLCVGGM